MTEAEWRACTDPTPMLKFLGDRASERKLRLFACACVRDVGRFLKEDGSREAILVAERFADGRAGPDDLAAALAVAEAAHTRVYATRPN
jgi:hypothetical protein